jgi:hypothetical protein
MALKGNSRGLLAKAVAYIRTSSAANIGADKDSDKRQRQAIAAFAQRSGLEFVGEFNGDGLHGRLWGCTRGYGGILKFLRFGALNLFSTDDSDTRGWS